MKRRIYLTSNLRSFIKEFSAISLTVDLSRLPQLILPRVILLGSLVLILARCGSQLTDTPAPASGTFGSVYNSLKSNNCTECHTPKGSATIDNHVALDFSTQALAYQTLTASTVSGTTSAGDCGGIKIVSPGNPSKSYLAAVLFKDYNTSGFADVTQCVPYNAHLTSFNLSSSEKTSIINWIQNGALNN